MITIRNLVKKYKTKTILDHISLNVKDPTKIYALMGESGSGKTTLFNILFGLDRDYSGIYNLFGKDASQLSNTEWANIREKYMSLVFQDYKLLEAFTVYENISFSGAYLQENVEEVLEELDILDLKDSQVSQLSGGQKQRVAIARAIVSQPKILLMDEPTGNLDGMTSEKIMGYLDKLRQKGILIFIITHDQSIAAMADVVFDLNEKVIIRTGLDDTLTNDEFAISPDLNEKQTKKKIVPYVLTSLKRSKKKIFYLAIPTTIIIALFILAFSAFRANSTLSLRKIFQGIGQQVIIMNTQNLTNAKREEFNKTGIHSSFDGQRIAFSDKDLEQVSSVDHVEEVYLDFAEVESHYNKDKHMLNYEIQKTNFSDTIQKYISMGNNVETITLNFIKNYVPVSWIDDYNKDNIELLSGHFPLDNSTQIVVPDVFVLQRKNNEDFDNIVGETVSLSVKDFEGESNQQDYTIAGVYSTNYKHIITFNYPIYTAYFEENSLDRYLSEETYKFYKNSLSINGQTKEFNRKIIEDYDAYKKAVGTGKSMMLVRVDHADQVPQVTAAIEEFYPDYHLLSQYDLKKGEVSAIYQKLVKTLIIGSSLIALIAGLLIAFLNKGYIHQRSKELAILYSLGYRKSEIYTIIAVENGLLFLLYFALACLLAYLSNTFFFSKSAYYQLFTNLFQPVNIGAIFLLTLLMVGVSIIWGIDEIKQKNLRKYLNE